MKSGPALTVAYRISKLGYLGPLILGLFLYGLGYGLFSLYDLGEFFLKQYWVALVVVGISWVSFSFFWAFKRHEDIYRNLSGAFNFGKSDFSKTKEEFMNDIHNDKKIIIFSLPFIALLVLYLVAATTSLIQVPPEVEQNILPNQVLFAYFFLLAVVSGYHFGMGAYLLVRHAGFVRRLSRHNVIIRPLQIDSENTLYKLSQFSFYSSGTWFVGVVLAVFIFRSQIDMITVAFLLLAVLVGAISFFLPQYFIHKSIIRSKEIYQKEIIKKFEPKWDDFEHHHNDIEILVLGSVYEKIENIKEWPTTMNLVGQEALSIIITIIITIYIPFTS